MKVSQRNKSEESFANVGGSIRDYKFISKISQGTYGKVDLYEKDGKQYAIKAFTNKKMGVLHLTTARELKALTNLKKCKYLITLEKVVFSDKEILAIFPYCSTSLTDKKYDCVSDLVEHFKQIVMGIQEIHAHGYLHRDLKSSNIMIDSNNKIRIIDFGMTRSVQPLMTSMVTTLWYRAPELLEHGSKNIYAKYSYKIDIWSLGIILMEMLLGYPPCKTNCEIEQLKIYKRDLVDLNIKYYFLPEKAKDLLNKILQFEPEKRFTLEDILNHDFCTIKQTEKMTYFNLPE